jgi:hypothetical protein
MFPGIEWRFLFSVSLERTSPGINPTISGFMPGSRWKGWIAAIFMRS